jgi:acyl carrier protein
MNSNESPEKIAETVIASIAQIKEIPTENITLNSTFEELNMDSLDGLDLFFELEEAFDLTVPDGRVQSIHTVHDVVTEIEKLISEKSANSPVES